MKKMNEKMNGKNFKHLQLLNKNGKGTWGLHF